MVGGGSGMQSRASTDQEIKEVDSLPPATTRRRRRWPTAWRLSPSTPSAAPSTWVTRRRQARRRCNRLPLPAFGGLQPVRWSRDNLQLACRRSRGQSHILSADRAGSQHKRRSLGGARRQPRSRLPQYTKAHCQIEAQDSDVCLAGRHTRMKPVSLGKWE